jgi:tRNA(Ile)-lysidine synthase
MTDETNSLANVMRNRIRHELLPLLEDRFVPGLSRRLIELADELRTLDDYVTGAACAELGHRCCDGRLDLRGFDQLAPALAQATLREFVRQRSGDLRAVSREHIRAMVKLCVETNPSGRVMLPGRRELRREYGMAVIESARTGSPAPSFRVVLDLRGATMIDAAGFTFEAAIISQDALELDFVDGRWRRAGPGKSVSMIEALFDADGLSSPLVVRNFSPGDRIAPLGMIGTRKVQDLLVDRKLARYRRSRWPLVTMADEVVWIPKIARSRTALVTADTRKVCHLRAAEHPLGGIQ